MNDPVLRVAVPSPLRLRFDYLPPGGCDPAVLRPGLRVVVPFGRRKVIGVVLAVEDGSELPRARLKPALELLDVEPLWSDDVFGLLLWAADYYHHPEGEVFAAAMPAALRQGQAPSASGVPYYRLSAEGRAVDPLSLGRAPRQAALMVALANAPQGAAVAQLAERHDNAAATLRRLRDKGWVERFHRPCLGAAAADDTLPPALNRHQQAAVQAVTGELDGFTCFLLDGVTGSGKTEVYLRVIARVLEQGRQALVLVPEIGLTPQLLERFRRRFPVPIAVLHSGLADGERLCAWSMARDGTAPIVIGTRSAVFVPLARPGVVIVDEEHDASFKQQDGFRYSGRDLAVVRAHRAGIPLLLGSATPSLESLHNVAQGRYRRLALPERAGAALHPSMRLLDLRHRPMRDGLSDLLLQAMERHLDAGGQVLLFLNRRGYAPTVLCHECGWVGHCRRCDAHLTLYGHGRLRCHHCGAEQAVPRQCPQCGSPDLRPVGQGTERVEQALQERFADMGVVRIDRDSTRRKGAMEAILEQVHEGNARVLVGTQMLAKGHHFPRVTLVAILDADQGLFSADFRAAERMAQLILQVAGRAGRAEHPGEVLIQTHHPEHPLFLELIAGDYGRAARTLMDERREAELPPYAHLALIRAEAAGADLALGFLEQVRDGALARQQHGVYVLGPVPAPMERRAGRIRAQLLLQAPSRARLHGMLGPLLAFLVTLPDARRVRWSLDVDPVEMY